MNLKAWIDYHRGDQPVRPALEALGAVAGISYMTLSAVYRGARIQIYAKAKALSVATAHEVTIPELCDDEITPEVAAQFEALNRLLGPAAHADSAPRSGPGQDPPRRSCDCGSRTCMVCN